MSGPASGGATDRKSIAVAAEAIGSARRVLALTGAGMSAESGIPTFREAQTGLWARFAAEDLATPEAFAREPERVWAWYRWRRTLIARGGVNAGHEALTTLAQRMDLAIATQNVDGLHAAAGNPRVAELHGNIWRERCSECAATTVRTIAIQAEDASVPRCERCGALMRPAVVWFGETLPAAAFNTAQRELEAADCVLVIGTSNRVYPAAAFVDAAIAGPATVVEINPEESPASAHMDIGIPAPAGRALRAIISVLDARQSRG